MSKIKTAFFCSQCGYESAKWLGKCPACSQWNTFTEELIHKDDKPAKNKNWQDGGDSRRQVKTILLEDLDASEQPRLLSGDDELDRVLVVGLYRKRCTRSR
jgi:DNA repair protein RadA/Sms